MHLPAQATLAVVVTRALHQALLMCNSHVSALQVPLLELLQLLVEAGADVTAQDALGQTPLQVALSNGNTACVGFLALRE
jgi:ankyrin repeat protein